MALSPQFKNPMTVGHHKKSGPGNCFRGKILGNLPRKWTQWLGSILSSVIHDQDGSWNRERSRYGNALVASKSLSRKKKPKTKECFTLRSLPLSPRCKVLKKKFQETVAFFPLSFSAARYFKQKLQTVCSPFQSLLTCGSKFFLTTSLTFAIT